MNDSDHDLGLELVYALRAIAKSVTPPDPLVGVDATGVRVASLTEAVMGMTSALVRIADAVGELAAATRERGK